VHSDKKKTPQQKPKVEQAQGPKVGIIFVVEHELILIKAVPVAEGEIYGESVTYPGGHEQFWEQLQGAGQVPQDQDYIDVPRGRVNFSRGQYLLLLDRCIRRRPKLLREIRQRLNLPRRALVVSSDDHYRCAACMSNSSF
jgi:hypothetical protein